jgi:MSHA biogenesis protein MshN
MSLINKMLQDLDQRNAPQPALGGASAGGQNSRLAQEVRAVRSRRFTSDFFWPVMSVLMLMAVGWVAWVAWQIMPHSVVTELVADAKPRRPEPPKAAASPGAAKTVPAAATASSKAPAAPVAAVRPAEGAPSKFDMLRLATELTTPIPAARAGTRALKSDKKKVAGASRRKSPAPELLAGGTFAGPGIDRHPNSTERERADREFQRGANLVNQGRIAEGMDEIRAALKIDPGYEAARQTLVALLLESKRVDEAAAVLREGLALNAANSGFAMLLARIMVERNDIKGALALLRAHAPQADDNAGYHAFAGALYQRLDRHDEAIEQYRAALKLSPGAGVWWMGLGISYQSTRRPKAAAEAFARAKSAGNLAPPLVAFVDQRLKQLR